MKRYNPLFKESSHSNFVLAIVNYHNQTSTKNFNTKEEAINYAKELLKKKKHYIEDITLYDHSKQYRNPEYSLHLWDGSHGEWNEAYERQYTKDPFLLKAIELHNICERFNIQNEKRMMVGDEDILYKYYTNISKFFKFVKEGYLDFLNKKIPNDKRKIQELKRKFDKDVEPYKDEIFNDAAVTHTNGTWCYSAIHEFLKELIKVDKLK